MLGLLQIFNPTPLGGQQYAADTVTEAVNAFASMPVKLTSDAINHSVDKILTRSVRGVSMFYQFLSFYFFAYVPLILSEKKLRKNYL